MLITRAAFARGRGDEFSTQWKPHRGMRAARCDLGAHQGRARGRQGQRQKAWQLQAHRATTARAEAVRPIHRGVDFLGVNTRPAERRNGPGRMGSSPPSPADQRIIVQALARRHRSEELTI